jgi:MFS family permease
MKKVSKNLLKFAIVCLAIDDGGKGVVSPALASIIKAFPHVSVSIVQMIATIPALALAIVPLVYPKMVDLLRKRTLLYIAAALFVIGGTGPAIFSTDIYLILFFRLLQGIGNGIIIPLVTDLVVDFFEGPEKDTMMGLISALTGLSGIIFQQLGGYFASFGWRYCFLAYLISILFFLVPFIFLPEPDRKGKIAAEEAVGKGKEKKLNGLAYLIAVYFTMFYVSFYVAVTNGAVVLAGEKLAAPTQIGTAFSCMTAGILISATFFGAYFKRIKYNTLWIAYLVGAAGLYIAYTGHSFIAFTIGLLVLGLGTGICVPSTITKLTKMVAYAAAPKAISLAYLAMGVGGFISPFIFNLFTVPGRAPFIYGAILDLAMCVFVFITNKATPAEAEPQATAVNNGN